MCASSRDRENLASILVISQCPKLGEWLICYRSLNSFCKAILIDVYIGKHKHMKETLDLENSKMLPPNKSKNVLAIGCPRGTDQLTFENRFSTPVAFIDIRMEKLKWDTLYKLVYFRSSNWVAIGMEN